jgi:hypothetical protein
MAATYDVTAPQVDVLERSAIVVGGVGVEAFRVWPMGSGI